MYHLFNSCVRVEELQLVVTDGVAAMDWAQATSEDPNAQTLLERLPCRLDMNFLRPGKDIAPAPEAGKAPDRLGIMFTYPFAPIKAGQRVVAIENDWGLIPVKGTFEIRVIPDEAQDFSKTHHLEVQIIETNQNLTMENWPAEEPDEED